MRWTLWWTSSARKRTRKNEGVPLKVLALDVGSSGVKAAVLRHGRLLTPITRASFPTRYAAGRAEVNPPQVLKAIAQAFSQLGDLRRQVDILSLCAMAPSWLALDHRGRPLTPIITHQHRRSIAEPQQLEQRVGASRYLRTAANRPFPGGISSSTAAWFFRHHPSLLRRADLVGHLNTYLLRQWTSARVTDPSNASFMGVYKTCTFGGWSDTLLAAVGLKPAQMPAILPGNQIAGHLTLSAATTLGLREGTPILPGIMDTSAAFLLAGAHPGQLVNVSGTTDVLALCVSRPHPHPLLLTRPLGVGRKWLAVSTLASAGSTLTWLHATLFPDLSDKQFFALMRQLEPAPSNLSFDAYLGGDRMSITQKTAGFSGLTLATTRQQMLAAALTNLARQSAARIPLLWENYPRISRNVFVSGGVGVALAGILHRDWPGRWQFRSCQEATLRGLDILANSL